MMAMGPSIVSLYPSEGYRGSIGMELTNNVALCANSWGVSLHLMHYSNSAGQQSGDTSCYSPLDWYNREKVHTRTPHTASSYLP
jgi:hypothetical protein